MDNYGNEIEDIEVNLVIDAIFQSYGYDFKNYFRASFTRRLRNFKVLNNFNHISDIIPFILYDSGNFNKLLNAISVTVTEMFRDPFIYKYIREKVIPYLNTYPTINIWVAGCATGEEAYSIAILLKEENILDKVNIYATDINTNSLDIAKEGVYSSEEMKLSTRNYQRSGANRSFSEYYHTNYGNSILNKELREKIIFNQHNLVSDASFNEMHFIICRNVLIYFNKKLQNRVIGLFNDSLIHNGFLCLGTKEDIRYSDYAEKFIVKGREERIFQKKQQDVEL